MEHLRCGRPARHRQLPDARAGRIRRAAHPHGKAVQPRPSAHRVRAVPDGNPAPHRAPCVRQQRVPPRRLDRLLLSAVVVAARRLAPHRPSAARLLRGLAPDDNAEGSTALGIQNYADAGIAGRGVLLDVPRFFADRGLDYDTERTIRIDARMLDELAAFHDVEFHGGELLLLRTAWAERYLAKSPEERAVTPWRLSPGLAQEEGVLRWLWEREIALVAADNLAVEADPVLESDFRYPGETPPERGVDHSGMLHRPLIALLGMALGELWKLDELAADCADDGVWEFFLTVKPLNLPGAAGSPPNALAIK
ncbi:cyclase family protein [Homoserinibacter gongjuensis]|uniref:cyclase family protein n=1 Tax=Homoserinibacter gongjuensis TaxID=1162968 RepID=UPI0024E0C2FC|nr:cyclase family protein [Homoserinibacter gongjuensis]